MKINPNHVCLGAIILVMVLLYLFPKHVYKYSNCKLARLLMVLALFVVTKYSPVCGVVLALVWILLLANSNNIEGMGNMEDMEDEPAQIKHTSDEDKKTSNDKESSDASSDLRKALCGKAKQLEPKELTKKYPSLKFKKDECNVCDETCEFEVTDAKERLSIEELLKPKNSNTESVVKSE